MGIVTVLIDRAWVMAPNCREVSSTEGSTRSASIKAVNNLQVRPTVPLSVENLAKTFYGTNDLKLRKRYEGKFERLLQIVGNLALSSSIADTLREDLYRKKFQLHPKKKKNLQKVKDEVKSFQNRVKNLEINNLGVNFPTKNSLGEAIGVTKEKIKPLSAGTPHYRRHQIANSNLGAQTRNCASQARRSLLALATIFAEHVDNSQVLGNTSFSKLTSTNRDARSRILKDLNLRLTVLDILQESLDTNELASDEHEVISLMLLAGKIREGLTSYHHRFFFSGVKDGSLFASSKPTSADTNRTEKVEEISIQFDTYTEKLFMCLLLTLQRLEFAHDIKYFEISKAELENFVDLSNVLQCCLEFAAGNPQISHILITMIQSIEHLTEFKVGKGEEAVAAQVSLSLLAQVIRMGDLENLNELADSFCDILADLQQKYQWYLGRKFINFLAAAASKNTKVCKMFIKILSRGEHSCWGWMYQGMLCLGVIAISGANSDIRSIALRSGLVQFVTFGESNNNTNDAWKVRAGVLVSLTGIYGKCNSTATKALIIDSLAQRMQLEKDDRVKQYICILQNLEPNSNNLLDEKLDVLETSKGVSRLSYLFKYISFSLAEEYIETQSKYKFLRKYVKSSNGKETQKQLEIRQKFEVEWESLTYLINGGTPKKNSSKSTRKAEKIDLTKLNQLSNTNDSNKANIPMSLQYHQNYKLAMDDEQVRESQTIDNTEELKKNIEPLKISLLVSHKYSTPAQMEVILSPNIRPSSVQKAGRGTVNRRKLFHKEEKPLVVKEKHDISEDAVTIPKEVKKKVSRREKPLCITLPVLPKIKSEP
ncbi:hypothetical protein HDU92_001652 [Lobulomyces angularis]|nr:hypothetical protein HDU92_001652 [Lobulomyces angularis]